MNIIRKLIQKLYPQHLMSESISTNVCPSKAKYSTKYDEKKFKEYRWRRSKTFKMLSFPRQYLHSSPFDLHQQCASTPNRIFVMNLKKKPVCFKWVTDKYCIEFIK